MVTTLAVGLGCSPPIPAQRAPMSQLQGREFQTRTYDTQDIGMVTKALVNVLQDQGFIVQTVNNDVGVVTASKERSERKWDNTFLHWGWWPILRTWTCTVNISTFGQQTKVRVNVQITATNYLTHEFYYAMDEQDPAYYTDFFSKVDKGIFIQRERL